MKHVLVIAEAGVNHNGKMDQAKALIDAAKEAKVDYVKFQIFKTSDLVKKDTPKANYQMRNDSSKGSQDDMLKRLELSFEQHEELYHYCNNVGVRYLCTPFDVASAQAIEPLVDFYKVSSSDMNNYMLLKFLASTEKPIIISTGMANLNEIEETVSFLKSCWNNKKLLPKDKVKVSSGLDMARLTVLHCTTSYPTSVSDVNLNAMITIRDRLNVSVGYSDHTLGVAIPFSATALGADVIEKHFTLDNDLPGPDHKASLNARYLGELVKGVRDISTALGSGEKIIASSEIENLNIARKGIYFKKNMAQGEVVTEEHLSVLRPQGETPANFYYSIIGKRTKSNFSAFDPVRLELLE